jgi:hypothetical protein
MNFEDRLALLTRKVRGWINHFRLADMKRILQDLDGWVRRRLRPMCQDSCRVDDILV